MKLLVVFFTSPFESCASVFSIFFVCVDHFLTVLVWADCFSTSGLVTTASFSLFLEKIFYVGTLVLFVSLGRKLKFC
jgi:hypothetical protein